MSAPKKLKDERPTAVLAKYSTALLKAALLDRAMDSAFEEVEMLTTRIESIEARNESRIEERAALRAEIEFQEGAAE